MKKILVLMIGVMLLIGTVAFSAIQESPYFVLSKFKMKLGQTQSLGAVIKGKNIDYDKVESSNPGVVKVLNDGTLKAYSTGSSTLTYKYIDSKDKEQEIYCHVEVTVSDATYDSIAGTKTETIDITLSFGDYRVIVESNKGAIPTLPKVQKNDLVFDGWYTEPEFLTKITEKDRFAKDTTLYGRWITIEEYEKAKIVPSALYDDITEHWGRIAIETVSYMGLFNGVADRTFGPDLVMTRAMAVSVLGRLNKTEVEGMESNVSDVPKGSYYDGYLAWARENSIVNDVIDNKFRPDDPITREEMAIYMGNFINYKGFKTQNVLETSYTDANEISSEAKDAIEMLYNQGIMAGNANGTFAPKASMTRAQIAQVFYNYNNFANKYKG